MRLHLFLAPLMTLGFTLAGLSLGWAGQPSSMQLAGPRMASFRSIVAADPASLCERAVTTVESATGLPEHLLQAISLTESGRIEPLSGRFRAWPWTINAEGQGWFFRTRQDAVAAVKGLQARGVQSIDVGCLQVNLMYHPNAFVSLDEAFDPGANARYAARFLNALYAQGKDWAHAISAYHSETPALGEPYRVLVMARWRDSDMHAPPPMGPFSGSSYRDFAAGDRVYGAFAPRARVYGAFPPR
jgi:soluble lytic murein transglycosylase-like protein